MRTNKYIEVELRTTGFKAILVEQTKEGSRSVRTLQQQTKESFDAAIKELAHSQGFRNLNAYLSLPRSEFFLVWRTILKPSPATLEAAAKEAFPLPLDDVYWTSISSESKEAPHLFIGIPKNRAFHYQKAFHAAGLNLKGIRSKLMTHLKAAVHKAKIKNKEATLFISLNDGSTDITVAQGSFPLFSRVVDSNEADATTLYEEASRTQAYVKKAHLVSNPETVIVWNNLSDKTKSLENVQKVFVAHHKPVQVLDSSDAALPDSSDILALPSMTPLSKPALLWQKQKTNLLAGASAALVLVSLLLGSAIETSDIEFRGLIQRERKLKAETDAPGLAASSDKPDNALPIFLSVTKQVPSALYVMDYRYDAQQRSVALRGRAADYKKVSEFSSALSKHSEFSEIKGEKASLVDVANRSVIEFSMEAKLR